MILACIVYFSIELAVATFYLYLEVLLPEFNDKKSGISLDLIAAFIAAGEFKFYTYQIDENETETKKLYNFQRSNLESLFFRE